MHHKIPSAIARSRAHLNSTQLLEQILSDYSARENWRGTVFVRFKFDHRGVHLEYWAVDLPLNEYGIGARRYDEGGAR